MHYKEKYLRNFIEYLRDIISENEESVNLVNQVECHLNKLKDLDNISFEYDKYSHVSSFCSLTINKDGNKIEEYFASGDDLTLFILRDGKSATYQV